MNAITLVLLPGLDGTDVFFRPLLAALPSSVRPLVVSYPTSSDGCTYEGLLAWTRRAISTIPECYVLGWSFAGPLALMLAEREPDKVRGVILSATFVRTPNAWLPHVSPALVTPVVWAYRAARRLPAWLFRARTDPWRQAKSETWTRVPARTVAARLQSVLETDAREILLQCQRPILYIASSQDEVIPTRNIDDVVTLKPSVTTVTISGPHLAMYTNAAAAANAITTCIGACEAVARPLQERRQSDTPVS